MAIQYPKVRHLVAARLLREGSWWRRQDGSAILYNWTPNYRRDVTYEIAFQPNIDNDDRDLVEWRYSFQYRDPNYYNPVWKGKNGFKDFDSCCWAAILALAEWIHKESLAYHDRNFLEGLIRWEVDGAMEWVEQYGEDQSSLQLALKKMELYPDEEEKR